MNVERVLRIWVVGLVFVGMMIGGCGGHSAKSKAQPTKKEVQGDSDRFFDRLHSEEQERKLKSGKSNGYD